MLYNPPLREIGRKDFHPKKEIEESIKGVEFDYFYTGKRTGTSGQIELHITSIVRDWDQNTYTRKAWFMGNKERWKDCIRIHIIDHLNDLNTGKMLVMSLMRDFEVSKDNFQEWEKYDPIMYRR